MAEQPQGTEYTLQGVMRFLQIEWHSHERARNTWDIERAEMKAKIAKQEGDCRHAKKTNEALNKQIRMLEKALKHERAKNKAIAAGQELPTEEEVMKEWNGKIGLKGEAADEPPKPAEEDPTESERDAQRDKSRHFLQKCVEEITYLLTPPAHPLPPQHSSQSLQQYVNQQEMQAQSEEAYLHQQQQLHQRSQQESQKFNSASLAGSYSSSFLPSFVNQTRPPPQSPRQPAEAHQQQPQNNQQSQPQALLMSRQINTQQPISSADVPGTTAESFQQQAQPPQSQPSEDQVERVTHSFDAFGRPLQDTEDEPDTSRPLINEDVDGWNFDEGNTLLETSDPPHPRRPDTDLFPAANNAKSPPRSGRRKSSGSGSMTRRRSDGAHEIRELSTSQGTMAETGSFKVRFQLRGHLDVVRSVIFTGGGSPSEPEICTTGDDGTIKRWIIPAGYSNYGNSQNQQQGQPKDHPATTSNNDLDIQSYFTHRGHDGIVTCLAACPPSPSFSTGGRALGDGWIFSGGQDATIRVWERGRVDPKATLEGHTDAIWTVCLLPSSSNSIFSSPDSSNPNANTERILLASGSADHTIKIWAVSAPPQLSSPQNPSGGTRRGSRRHSVTSGSGFPSSPQPSTASGIPFHYTLVHSIKWPDSAAASPTCISPLGPSGENFVVSYSDSSVLIFDTRTGEEVVGMASSETYDGTAATGVNSVVVSTHNKNAEGSTVENNNSEDESVVQQIVSGHEDRFIRFYDAVSGQCTYSMLAHPASIASLALSPDGRELVSAGHDASLRFWSLEKRACVQEINSHRIVRGEGVVSVVWSQDGKWVVSGGGDGVVKVFGR